MVLDHCLRDDSLSTGLEHGRQYYWFENERKLQRNVHEWQGVATCTIVTDNTHFWYSKFTIRSRLPDAHLSLKTL